MNAHIAGVIITSNQVKKMWSFAREQWKNRLSRKVLIKIMAANLIEDTLIILHINECSIYPAKHAITTT